MIRGLAKLLLWCLSIIECDIYDYHRLDQAIDYFDAKPDKDLDKTLQEEKLEERKAVDYE